MFFTDTCFWTHAQILSEHQIYDFKTLLDEFDFGITPQIRKEIEYFLPGILDLDKFNIRPVLDWEFNEMYKIDPVLSDFDLADQSLFIMGKKYGEIILTDDGGLSSECLSYKITAFSLSDFSISLLNANYLTKNLVHKIIKCLLNNRIIRFEKYNQLQKRINLL